MFLYVSDIDELNNDKNAFETAYKLLPEFRKQKVDKIKPDRSRKCSVAAFILLMYGLINYEIDPYDFEIEINEYGKPSIKGKDNIHFSISHSDSKVICAVGKNNVGCDVERINPRKKTDGIIGRFYHSNEKKYIENFQEDDKTKAFFDIWTLKESYVKMIGKGLYVPFDSFGITIGNNKITCVTDKTIENIKIESYDIFNEYSCGICIDNSSDEVEIIELNILEAIKKLCK